MPRKHDPRGPYCMGEFYHYEVLSAMVCYQSYSYNEPPEQGCDWTCVIAKNSRDAKRIAALTIDFKDSVNYNRSEGSNPFVGMKASLMRCKHGVCLGCVTDGICNKCENEYQDDVQGE